LSDDELLEVLTNNAQPLPANSNSPERRSASGDRLESPLRLAVQAATLVCLAVSASFFLLLTPDEQDDFY